MHKLLERQVRSLALSGANNGLDLAAMLAVINRTYDEFDRERRLNYRAAQLTEEELKAANAKARERHATILSAVVGNVPDAVLILKSCGEVESTNLAAEGMFGGHDRALSGLNVSMLVLDREGWPISLDAAHSSEASGRSIDGRTFPVEYSFASFEAEEGPRHLMIARDISERKQHEAEVTAAKEAAESANQLKSQFLAMMSHELRTPLNAILGFSEIIRDCALGDDPKAWEKYREYAGLAHDSGRHLLALICDILDLSKIEAGNYNLDIEPVDVRELIHDCVALVRPMAEKNGVTLAGIDSLTSTILEADKRALKQIFLNLFSNAVKFTTAGGEVKLRVVASGHLVEIAVTDTGIGISKEHLETVFEPFRQLDSGTSRRYEGTGLGLTISRRLVELHGGDIRLESQVGRGTRAVVRLRAKLAEPVHIFA